VTHSLIDSLIRDRFRKCNVTHLKDEARTTRYDTKEQFNVDSKASWIISLI